MNLASQSVLEGLNACLDHRGEVYISELDQIFKKNPNFKIFAAQNPHHQGGGRKGLPSSFVNRFIVVYADVFTEQDLLLITASERYNKVNPEVRHRMIEFISNLDNEVVLKKSFGAQGSPWEFNLRDTLRWLDLLSSDDPVLSDRIPDDFLDVVIRQRFRTDRDRQEVSNIFAKVFNRPPSQHSLYHDINPNFSQVGLGTLARSSLSQKTPFPPLDPTVRLAEIESVMIAIKCNIPCILVGPSGSGKSVVLQHAAALTGKPLVVFPLNADVDTMDLIGGFEQADPHREINACLNQLQAALEAYILGLLPHLAPPAAADLLSLASNWRGDTQDTEGLLSLIRLLYSETTLSRDLKTILSTASHLLNQPLVLDNPRFEWLDGVIVRAVQTGQWLVLDNANLCSASVLDRLNSLLERPRGFLSINEHTGPDGEPRIITPHPDFRIFLTVDPRYGELSRAMRNRSIEVFLDEHQYNEVPYLDKISPVESTLQRFSNATNILNRVESGDAEAPLEPLAFDLLSLADTRLLKKFASTAEHGLFREGRLDAVTLWLTDLTSYTEAADAAALRQAVSAMYGSSPQGGMLMPIHPLQNPAIVSILDRLHHGLPHWLSACYETYLELHGMQKDLKNQLFKVNVRRPAFLNRLQRSHISGEVATLSKDSTVNAEEFLLSTMKELHGYIRNHLDEAGNWPERISTLTRMVLFWRQTFDILCAMPFEEARFQAHLTLGSGLLRSHVQDAQEDKSAKSMTKILKYLEDAFVVGFKLSTGLSMEVLWNILRPEPIRDYHGLEQVVEMEKLAARFDALRWKVKASVSDLGGVMQSLSQSYTIIRTSGRDATDLVRDLQTEIVALESKINDTSVDSRPFYAASFEAIRQAIVLHQVSQPSAPFGSAADVLVLSDTPTLSEMRLQAARGNKFSSLDYLLGQATEVHPWTGTISETLLQSYDLTTKATIRDLQSVEAELPLMGKALAKASEALTTDALDKLAVLLLDFILDVMAVHDESARVLTKSFYELLVAQGDFSSGNILENVSVSIVNDFILQHAAGWPPHLASIFKDHFSKSLVALAASARHIQPRSKYASAAWVQFTLGCLKLYIPDRVFDPYLRAQVEMEYYRQFRETLQNKINALAAFELAFTGQTANLRGELLKQQLEVLGESPSSVPAIYRPGGESLATLQGEFNNVLNVLVRHDISSSHFRYLSTSSEDEAQELDLVKENVVRLIGRFTGHFDAYQDLTMPLISLLRCLQIGLSLSPRSLASSMEDTSVDSSSLLRVIPFLNGTVWAAEREVLPIRSFEFLSTVQSIVAVDGLANLSIVLRRALFDSLASFYEEWKKKVEADRKAEESSTSLYRFKGSFEDEEEFDQKEFDDLFPTYQTHDDDPTPKKRPQRGIRDLSVLLAEAYEKIFLSTQDAQHSIRAISRQVARKFARESSPASTDEVSKDKLLLPAVMLIIDEKSIALNASIDPNGYNFYTEPNLGEVRKLLGLVNDIKARFQYLLTVDEISHHQTLLDVVMACDHVLEMSIDEPLAKIITGVERLHSFVYEWHEGGWASRIHKSQTLFEQLRDTICDWRRLELSSWARLFDMEQSRCRDDAKSWWCIAYGAIVLEPCSRLQEGQDLKPYAVELLHLLESYFSETIAGQYTARLNLIQQFKSHLDLLAQDGPELTIICDALQNFITLYRRYEPKVTELIQKGRAPLDRSMKDVLLMAKWNDKNIDALRASARKSHQKLFKLVRKFRAVLGQPMKPIVEQGLPDEEHPDQPADESEWPKLDIDPKAITLSKQLIPGLEQQAQWERLAHPEILTKVMAKHGSIPSSAVPAPEVLQSFMSDLVSSMVALRKETPATLTDENKEEVKHLKMRKTRLFVDTLASIRQMGFSRSLGTKILDRQNSTQLVLSDAGLINFAAESQLNAVEYYFHKTLDLAPRFRKTLVDYSEDLSRENVGRSVGHLEGILYVMFQQRQYLARAAKTMSSLDKALLSVKNVSMKREGSVINKERQVTNHAQVLRWIIQILKTGIHLVEIHERLGGPNSSNVRLDLDSRLVIFVNLEQDLMKMPSLPPGFDSSGHRSIRTQIDSELAKLRELLSKLEHERLDLAFILQQIQLWVTVHGAEVASEGEELSTDNLVSAVMTLSSRILVAIQHFGAESKALPTSVEEASWLVRYSSDLSKAIGSLRAQSISDELENLLQLLKRLDLDNTGTSQMATILLRAVFPVLQQYMAVYQKNLLQFLDVHRETCKLGYTLSKSFIQLAGQGFCTPQEKSDDKGGDSGKLEGGTGLGDGEGAEDISKDIQPDEDLTELAQEPNTKQESEIEQQKDAVDMGDEDLEGDMGSVAGEEEEDDEGKKSGDEEDEDDGMEDEAGDVDDLDPTTVDEKMWDGDSAEDADKDQEGDNNKGQEKKDEQSAADDKKKGDTDNAGQEEAGEQGDDDLEDEELAGEEDEANAQEELNRQDQNVQETEALDLPDNMELDIDDGASISGEDDALDDLDDLSDVEKPEELDGPDSDAESTGGDDNVEEQTGKGDEVEEEDETPQETKQEDQNMEADENQEEEAQDKEDDLQNRLEDQDQGATDQDNIAPSEAKSGGGQAQMEMDMQDNENSESKAAQAEQGATGQDSADQDMSTGNKGVLSSAEQERSQPEDNQSAKDTDSQPFKKLGDALERWHRNQRDIKTAQDDEEAQQKHDMNESEMAQAEFQHLQDETAEADTQAMGTATDEEAKPMDDAMAIDEETEETQNRVLPENDQEDGHEQDIDMDEQDVNEPQDVPPSERDNDRSGVATRKGAYDEEMEDNARGVENEEHLEEDEEEEIEETSTQLLATHISEVKEATRDYSEALAMWSTFQTKTHPLSLALTSQLRLILTPSQSTKLSGAFRTGKRLNIKKIIPYIASSYKRDKIWMRRAIPTKRAYQILLCVDDSSSMGETSSGVLALESFVMVSRALALLEVGQVGVVGFGTDVFTAHDLTQPFAGHDAGARVLQKFTFQQQGTDICQLLRSVIAQFQLARLRNSVSGSEDLWQLALILSDGLVQSSHHARIRPLLREAMEARIMVVFIVMDDANKSKGESVLSLKEAKFTSDGGIVVERYLDSFPFPYYLIVHHLDDLPGALAGLLRTWFAEVNS